MAAWTIPFFLKARFTAGGALVHAPAPNDSDPTGCRLRELDAFQK